MKFSFEPFIFSSKVMIIMLKPRVALVQLVILFVEIPVCFN